MICAERLGFTGIGGGGAGESRPSSVLWSSLRVLSSWLRMRELELVLTALDVGSSWIGRRVKVSVSSMIAERGKQLGFRASSIGDVTMLIRLFAMKRIG